MAKENNTEELEVMWLQALPEDVEGFDFEGVLEDCNSADCHDLSDIFRKAADLHEKLADANAAPAVRIFSMLCAVTDFHFRPEDRNEPFGPKMQWDGKRTAIPEDFRGEPVKTLAILAERATNPVLKARLCDTSWLLERSRHELGVAAISAYVNVIESLDNGELVERLEKDDPFEGPSVKDLILRALSIGRAFKPDLPETVTAKDLLLKIKDRVLANKAAVPIKRFFEMDLDFGISEPSAIANAIENFVNENGVSAGVSVVPQLWRLAARGYHRAKDDDSENRCRVAAAEALVTESENHNSAMVVSNWLSDAIAEYHGIPNTRERRTELRHKLIDVQSGIPDEMSSFSEPIDLKDIVEATEEQLEKLSDIKDKLFLFASLDHSPDPEQLERDAVKAISEHPLSSLFGSSFHDHEGKVVHRVAGGGLGENDNEGAIRTKVAQHEQIRRDIFVTGQIRIAVRHISDQHYIGEDTFHAVFQNSPFVPNDLIGTFSRGFQRFFASDFTSALYILTPLLENSLRHVLKMAGHDVTNFDDATQTQQDRTITALYDQMREELEKVFGRATIDDIDRVFLARPGPTIRHDVAHGLLHDGSPYGADAIYGCWLIFRLCMIPLFKRKDEILVPA